MLLPAMVRAQEGVPPLQVPLKGALAAAATPAPRSPVALPRGASEQAAVEGHGARHLSVTPGEAARHAQHINGGGRVLSVIRRKDGYRVKLIKNGEVRVIFVAGN